MQTALQADLKPRVNFHFISIIYKIFCVTFLLPCLLKR